MKTSLKIASSGLFIFFVIVSICESLRDYPGTKFRGAVSKLGEKIQIRGCTSTFSVKLEKWSFDVPDLPRTGKKYTEKKHLKAFVFGH